MGRVYLTRWEAGVLGSFIREGEFRFGGAEELAAELLEASKEKRFPYGPIEILIAQEAEQASPANSLP